MESIQNRIQQLKENGFSLSFSETLNEAFRIWQKIFWYGLLATTIFGVFSFIVSSALEYLPFVSEAQGNMESVMQAEMQSGSPDMDNIKEAAIEYYKEPGVLFVNLFSQLLLALIFPIFGGLVYLAYKADTEDDVDIAYLFEGFNGNRFGRILLLYILYKLASFVGLIFLGIGFFIPFVGFALASSFIMINDMKTMEAIRASFSLTYKHFFTVLLLMLLACIIAYGGILLCFIGFLFTFPIAIIMTYSIYKMIIGVHNVDDVNEIGTEV